MKIGRSKVMWDPLTDANLDSETWRCIVKASMLMKCVIYARSASIDQLGGDTVPSQLASLRRFAARKGWRIATEFSDRGKSGLKPYGATRSVKVLRSTARALGIS
jgi:hypothetical protein